jgi:hypothetical protein
MLVPIRPQEDTDYYIPNGFYKALNGAKAKSYRSRLYSQVGLCLNIPKLHDMYIQSIGA